MARISRRTFLRGALASAAGISLYGGLVERNWLDIVRLDLPLRKLPDAFAGFTIAQISDLHFGIYFGPSSMDPIVQAVVELNADAIVITGDIVSRVTHGEPEMIVQELSRLHAPHGVFAVLGNHDWWQNGPLVAESLRRAGVTVLSNEYHVWQRGGQALHLTGIDDVFCGKCDLEKALHAIPADAAVLTLVHEPDYADIIARDPRVILQLSGHSHGGQVCVPFLGGLIFPPWGRKYSSGLYQIDELTLYTNRGVGVIALPVRVACRPEITLFTLKPAG